jgi:hypothetical protein
MTRTIDLRSAALLGVVALGALGGTAWGESPYSPSAGKSAPTERRTRTVWDDKSNTMRSEEYDAKPAADHWGNAQGNQHDLAVDGAFKGQTVAVLHLYVDSSFDFNLPKAALAEKGFSTYRWISAPPPPDELARSLEKSSQLWIISGASNLLTPEHVAVIKKFFDAGHGVYIWGDNEPYYADANVVAQALLGTQMHGNLMGDKTVGMLGGDVLAGGIRPNHLLSTGLENIYEGITIATIDPGSRSSGLEPLIYGSAGNLVAAYYDQGGRRAILDGGFTRLYMKWDTAGTARYVKNAAAWLVNAEKFGDAVINPELTKVPSVHAIALTPPASPPQMMPPHACETSGADSFPSNRMGWMLLALFAGLAVLLYLPRRFR